MHFDVDLLAASAVCKCCDRLCDQACLFPPPHPCQSPLPIPPPPPLPWTLLDVNRDCPERGAWEGERVSHYSSLLQSELSSPLHPLLFSIWAGQMVKSPNWSEQLELWYHMSTQNVLTVFMLKTKKCLPFPYISYYSYIRAKKFLFLPFFLFRPICMPATLFFRRAVW